jgi:single-stranded-DNA-specific exonuclease
MLAACGVTFMACVAINNKLRGNDYYKTQGMPEPKLMELLDLIALGTVCDMVPLHGVNRLLVRSGFKQMQGTVNTGLAALIETSKINKAVNTYHAGFVLGPRINAGSRVHKSDLGAKLLSTEDREEAINIAWVLNDCNDRRKEIQVQMEREAFDKVEALRLDQNACIIVGDESWHPGLSGLVAGKIKDRYDKPACVITYALNSDGTREGRGSGRSVAGVNIGRAFMAAMEQGLIPKGGGHAMAGGFTLEPDKLEAFSVYLNKNIAAQAENAEANIETTIDGVMAVQGAKTEFVEMLDDLVGPFGMDFPEPVFAFNNVRIYNPTIRGETHISIMLSDWEGGARMKAMAFGAVGTPLGDALLKDSHQKAFHLIGQLKINEWQGRKSAELHIQDGCYAKDGN